MHCEALAGREDVCAVQQGKSVVSLSIAASPPRSPLEQVSKPALSRSPQGRLWQCTPESSVPAGLPTGPPHAGKARAAGWPRTAPCSGACAKRKAAGSWGAGPPYGPARGGAGAGWPACAPPAAAQGAPSAGWRPCSAPAPASNGRPPASYARLLASYACAAGSYGCAGAGAPRAPGSTWPRPGWYSCAPPQTLRCWSAGRELLLN